MTEPSNLLAAIVEPRPSWLLELNAPDRSLRDWVQQASDAWPGLQVPADGFARHLVDHMSRRGATIDPCPPAYLGDLYLSFACGIGIPRAHAAFERNLVPAVNRALSHLRLSEDTADDVRQRLREHLFFGRNSKPAILAYAGRGKLEAWVRVAAVQIARRMLGRARTSNSSETVSLPEALEDSMDPELVFMRQRHGARFAAVLRRGIDLLEPRDRLVLALATADRLHHAEIAKLFGVHRTTVLRWIAGARARVVHQAREIMAIEDGLRPEEFDTLMRALRSAIHITMSRYLVGVDQGAQPGQAGP